MKGLRISAYILAISLISCSSADKTPSEKIVGIWQQENATEHSVKLEFDKDGNYYLIKDNKRLETENKMQFTYRFIESKKEGDKNFQLTETNIGYTYSGKVTFLDENNMLLSLWTAEASTTDKPTMHKTLKRVQSEMR